MKSPVLMVGTGSPPVVPRSSTALPPAFHWPFTGLLPAFHRPSTGLPPAFHRPSTGRGTGGGPVGDRWGTDQWETGGTPQGPTGIAFFTRRDRKKITGTAPLYRKPHQAGLLNRVLSCLHRTHMLFIDKKYNMIEENWCLNILTQVEITKLDSNV